MKPINITYFGNSFFGDIVKGLEMVRVSWIIWETLNEVMCLYKREAKTEKRKDKTRAWSDVITSHGRLVATEAGRGTE